MRKMRKPPIGARPGTLAIPSDATKSVLRVLSYDAETIEEYDSPNLAGIRELTATGRRLWVDVQGLGDEKLLRGLAEFFKIHPLALEDLANASPDTLRELNSTKGQMLALKRAITPQREAVNKMIRDESGMVSQQVRPYLRDTCDHVVQTTEAVESARELVNGLINTYLSVISNRMNEVMKTLTIVASIFVPLTFLAGIYGMNFENMPELQQQWAYPVVLSLMTLTAGGMVLYFWRKGWIGSRR